jgi:hypothetical protein
MFYTHCTFKFLGPYNCERAIEVLGEEIPNAIRSLELSMAMVARVEVAGYFSSTSLFKDRRVFAKLFRSLRRARVQGSDAVLDQSYTQRVVQALFATGKEDLEVLLDQRQDVLCHYSLLAQTSQSLRCGRAL